MRAGGTAGEVRAGSYLRHWEEVGLLRPSGRSEGGFQPYTDEDVEKILVIRRMKPLGFALDSIRADAAQRRERLVGQLAMADEFIDLLSTQAARPE